MFLYFLILDHQKLCLFVWGLFYVGLFRTNLTVVVTIATAGGVTIATVSIPSCRIEMHPDVLN